MTAYRLARTASVRSAAGIVSAAFIALVPHLAFAHGGLSMEKDLCKLFIGPYTMHFTGYQPLTSGTQEFCEDIPNVGEIVVVLDAVDSSLRKVPIDVRIIRDTGVPETEQDDIENVTVMHLPAKVYSSGTVSLEHTFPKPGKFVGLVTAVDPNGTYVSRFPFSVARSWSWMTPYLLIGIVVLAGAGLYWYSTNLPKMRAARALRKAR